MRRREGNEQEEREEGKRSNQVIASERKRVIKMRVTRTRGNEEERMRERRDEERGQRFALGTRYIDRPYAMLVQWRGVLGR